MLQSQASPVTVDRVFKFPCFAKHIYGDTILLVTGSNSALDTFKGTVVVPDEKGPKDIGNYRDDWCGRFFEPFHGTVTIASKT